MRGALGGAATIASQRGADLLAHEVRVAAGGAERGAGVVGEGHAGDLAEEVGHRASRARPAPAAATRSARRRRARLEGLALAHAGGAADELAEQAQRRARAQRVAAGPPHLDVGEVARSARHRLVREARFAHARPAPVTSTERASRSSTTLRNMLPMAPSSHSRPTRAWPGRAACAPALVDRAHAGEAAPAVASARTSKRGSSSAAVTSSTAIAAAPAASAAPEGAPGGARAAAAARSMALARWAAPRPPRRGPWRGHGHAGQQRAQRQRAARRPRRLIGGHAGADERHHPGAVEQRVELPAVLCTRRIGGARVERRGRAPRGPRGRRRTSPGRAGGCGGDAHEQHGRDAQLARGEPGERAARRRRPGRRRSSRRAGRERRSAVAPPRRGRGRASPDLLASMRITSASSAGGTSGRRLAHGGRVFEQHLGEHREDAGALEGRAPGRGSGRARTPARRRRRARRCRAARAPARAPCTTASPRPPRSRVTSADARRCAPGRSR